METIKHLELELLASETRKNPKRLDALLADDFFEFTRKGAIHTKKDIIEALPKCPEERFDTSEFQETLLADGVILATYQVERMTLSTGEHSRMLCSSIWQKRNNIWQMRFFQGTTISGDQ